VSKRKEEEEEEEDYNTHSLVWVAEVVRSL
jgi:hypothetical protein